MMVPLHLPFLLSFPNESSINSLPSCMPANVSCVMSNKREEGPIFSSFLVSLADVPVAPNTDFRGGWCGPHSSNSTN